MKKKVELLTVIVTLIVVSNILYVIFDVLSVRPGIRRELRALKKQQTELSQYMDKKLPQIDSALSNYMLQIEMQKAEIKLLELKLK